MGAAGQSEVRIPEDADLRLPRPPGLVRRFWARHPLLVDILVTLLSLVLALAGAAAGASAGGEPWPVGLMIILLTIATCGALLVRRRLPMLGFVLAIVLQLTSIAVPHGASIAPLVLTTYALAVYGSTRLCTIAAMSGTGVVVATSIVALGIANPAIALGATVNTFFNTALAVLFGALVGVNVGNRKRYLDAVIARSRQLLVERDQQAELAAAAERERIAREMHDIVSHSLTVIVALSEGASATTDTDRAQQAMHAAATTARGALTEMRAMLGVLRSEDPAAPLAPMAAIVPAEVVAAAQRAGFPVTLTTTGPALSQPPVAYAVGRIVQEGLTNALRHAPAARDIRVRIDVSEDRVRVSVANDGVRPAPASAPGYGIRGLQERARHVGGELESGPDGTACWMLRAELPLDAVPGKEPR